MALKFSSYVIVGFVSTVAYNLPTQAATMTFSDGTFEASNWQISTLVPSLSGRGSATQQLVGGHSDAYREMTANLPASNGINQAIIITYHKYLGSTYNIRQNGSILDLDFSIDTRHIHGGGDGGWYGIALEQNGETFYHFVSTAPETNWTTRSLTNLTQNDFEDIFAPTLVHPDFSINGAPMSFGFFYNVASAQNMQTPEMTFISGADNWRVKLNLANDGIAPAVPEPNFILSLVGFVAVGLGCRLLNRK